MRIATWNVNSLKARLERIMGWLERAQPDVLLMQETKLADGDAPSDAFEQAGYALAHHGEGRWNGVAIASRCGIDAVVTNFGEALHPPQTSESRDEAPLGPPPVTILTLDSAQGRPSSVSTAVTIRRLAAWPARLDAGRFCSR